MGLSISSSQKMLKMLVFLSITFVGLSIAQYTVLIFKIKDIFIKYGMTEYLKTNVWDLIVGNMIGSLLLIGVVILTMLFTYFLEKEKAKGLKSEASIKLKSLDLYSLIREENTLYLGRRHANREDG